MQKTIHFRVLLDFEKDVFRDIEINSTDTFLTLHTMIQEAFGFDNSQMASFYESNMEWEKGQEIALMEVKEPDEEGEPIWLMENTPLDKLVIEKDQKFLYVFDFLLMWCFYIDVIKVAAIEDNVILPRISQTFGDAPEQYSKTGDLVFDGIEVDNEDDSDVEEGELEELFRLMSDHEDQD